MTKARLYKIKNQGTKGTQGTNLNAQPFSGSPVKNGVKNGGNSKIRMEDRPCYLCHDDPEFPYDKAGLWFHGVKETSEECIPIDVWICTPIHCVARTESKNGTNHGLILRFKTSSGKWTEWAMPLYLLSGNGEELRRELLDRGMRISIHQKFTLIDWLMQAYPDRYLVAVDSLGWNCDSFVLPSQVIGHKQNFIYQHENVQNHFAESGTLQSWQDDVGIYLQGNPLCILSVSAALSGSLLYHTGLQGGGLHLVGDSSTGKSTMLLVAASVWGGTSFIRTWRATANGLEAEAATVNDTALILDEISQADPREVGNMVYTVGNGVGKARATKSGLSRPVARWRVMLLSSGERSLAAHMREDMPRRQPKAGQIVRLLDIPVARRFGAFDDVHTFPDGASLSNHLKHAVTQNYGTLGVSFIKTLVEESKNQDFRQSLLKILDAKGFQSKNGLHRRAAATLAICALAGEWAIAKNLLPLQRGEAMAAAVEAFQGWLANQEDGGTEDMQILANVNDFIDKHGSSRFAYLGKNSEAESGTDEETYDSGLIRDRAGWLREDIYLFTPSGLREAIGGHDLQRALNALEGARWIAAKDRNKRSKKTKIAGRAVNLYWIRPHDENEGEP